MSTYDKTNVLNKEKVIFSFYLVEHDFPNEDSVDEIQYTIFLGLIHEMLSDKIDNFSDFYQKISYDRYINYKGLHGEEISLNKREEEFYDFLVNLKKF